MYLYSSFGSIIYRGLLVAFLLQICGPLPNSEAQLVLPAPGHLVPLSPAYSPAVLKGIKLDAQDPFKFHFYVDPGNSVKMPNFLGGNAGGQGVEAKQSQQEQLKSESSKLIKYFLASLTVPESDLWVNLSPYEKNRLIPTEFGQTEMGRDLLAEDYLLKQITASLIYPESKIGQTFWQKIYAQAQAKYHTTNIPINTFNKVWIVPDKAVVYENGSTAFVLESHLKVMLEEDYLSLQKHRTQTIAATHSLGSQIIRELVIPALTKEVNEGKNFAPLRQVFYSLILATWYKQKIKNSILNKIYADQKKTTNLSSSNASVGDPQQIYQQYLKAFKKGVFNYIKESPDLTNSQTIPRKYFSGGVVAAERIIQYEGPKQISLAQIAALDSAQLMDVSGDMGTQMMRQNSAMITIPKYFFLNRYWTIIPFERYKDIPVVRDQSRKISEFILDKVKRAIIEYGYDYPQEANSRDFWMDIESALNNLVENLAQHEYYPMTGLRMRIYHAQEPDGLNVEFFGPGKARLPLDFKKERWFSCAQRPWPRGKAPHWALSDFSGEGEGVSSMFDFLNKVEKESKLPADQHILIGWRDNPLRGHTITIHFPALPSSVMNTDNSSLSVNEAMTSVERNIRRLLEPAYTEAWGEMAANPPAGVTEGNFYFRETSNVLVPLVFQRLMSSTRYQNVRVVASKDIFHPGEHQFLLLFYKGTFWVIDPTYQQFLSLDKRDTNQKVLIARLENLPKEARELEISGPVDPWMRAIKADKELFERITSTPGYETLDHAKIPFLHFSRLSISNSNRASMRRDEIVNEVMLKVFNAISQQEDLDLREPFVPIFGEYSEAWRQFIYCFERLIDNIRDHEIENGHHHLVFRVYYTTEPYEGIRIEFWAPGHQPLLPSMKEREWFSWEHRPMNGQGAGLDAMFNGLRELERLWQMPTDEHVLVGYRENTNNEGGEAGGHIIAMQIPVFRVNEQRKVVSVPRVSTDPRREELESQILTILDQRIQLLPEHSPARIAQERFRSNCEILATNRIYDTEVLDQILHFIGTPRLEDVVKQMIKNTSSWRDYLQELRFARLMEQRGSTDTFSVNFRDPNQLDKIYFQVDFIGEYDGKFYLGESKNLPVGSNADKTKSDGNIISPVKVQRIKFLVNDLIAKKDKSTFYADLIDVLGEEKAQRMLAQVISNPSEALHIVFCCKLDFDDEIFPQVQKGYVRDFNQRSNLARKFLEAGVWPSFIALTNNDQVPLQEVVPHVTILEQTGHDFDRRLISMMDIIKPIFVRIKMKDGTERPIRLTHSSIEHGNLFENPLAKPIALEAMQQIQLISLTESDHPFTDMIPFARPGSGPSQAMTTPQGIEELGPYRYFSTLDLDTQVDLEHARPEMRYLRDSEHWFPQLTPPQRREVYLKLIRRYHSFENEKFIYQSEWRRVFEAVAPEWVEQGLVETVGMLGVGTFGSGILRTLLTTEDLYSNVALKVRLGNKTPSGMREQVEADKNIELAKDNDDILLDPKIKSVIIATPARTHYELVKAALNAGKNVYVEKPFTLDPNEAEELVQLAQEKHLVLVVGHLFLHSPQYQYLQSLVQSPNHVLGEINSIKANILNLPRKDLEDINVLQDIGYHDLYMVAGLLNQDLPDRLNRVERSEDWETAHLDMQYGHTHVNVDVSRVYQEDKPQRRIVIEGTKYTVVFDHVVPYTITIEPTPGTVVNQGELQSLREEIQKVSTELPLAPQMRAFVRAVKDGHVQLASGESAIPIVRLIAQITHLLSGNTLEFGPVSLTAVNKAMRVFTDTNDFANHYMVGDEEVSGMRPFVGEKSVQEIIDHELPNALFAIEKIKALRKWMDEHGASNRPLIIWQNMRLGEMYPLFTDKLKHIFGITERVINTEDVEEWRANPENIPEAVKHARIILCQAKRGSGVSGNYSRFEDGLNRLSQHIHSGILMIDNSIRNKSIAQITLRAYLTLMAFLKVTLALNDQFQSNTQVLDLPTFWAFLNANPNNSEFNKLKYVGNVLTNEHLSWMDDRWPFVDEHSTEEVIVAGEKQKVYDLARMLYGEAIDQAVEKMIADEATNTTGGINLNPAQMSLQVKHQGEDFKFDYYHGIEINAAQVTGIDFTIRHMEPVKNLPQVLGLN